MDVQGPIPRPAPSPRPQGGVPSLPPRLLPSLALLLALATLLLPGAQAAPSLDDARAALRLGKHADVIKAAMEAIEQGGRTEDWAVLHAKALLATGQYPAARDLLTNAAALSRRSLPIRWLGHHAALAAGDTNSAASLLDDIRLLINAQAADLRDPRARVALAEAAIVLGADPKVVIEKILEPLRKSDPALPELHLARGNIALDKHDAALAAMAFEEGIRSQPDDPDLHHGLARAHLDGDRSALVEALENALRIDERHVPSLLLLVDHQIDAEDYAEAERNLDAVAKVNPAHPDAWAFRAVLAHLRNNPAAEAEARSRALQPWPTNPRVDHIIGLKLSRKYRFAEGSARQRQALAFDPSYLPAKSALASDLLRLGEEDEGWKLAHEVHQQDAYDVAAFNLVTLHDSLGRYTRLTNEHFVVRLSSKEAPHLRRPRPRTPLPRPGHPRRQVRRRARLPHLCRDLRRAEGLRRPHLRHPRQPRLPRRLLRPRRHRQRPRRHPRPRFQLGGRPLARVHPCHHPPGHRQPHAPLAFRGHLRP